MAGYTGGQDYYNSPQWAEEQRKNVELQAAIQANRDAEDQYQQQHGGNATGFQLDPKLAAASTQALRNYGAPPSPTQNQIGAAPTLGAQGPNTDSLAMQRYNQQQAPQKGMGQMAPGQTSPGGYSQTAGPVNTTTYNTGQLQTAVDLGLPQSAQQTGGAKSPWLQTGTGNQITIRGKGGETKTIDAGSHEEIDQALRSGYWTPLNSQGQPMEMRDYQGGQMFKDPSTGQWNPLNKMLGGDWAPGQQQAMGGFMGSLPPQQGGNGVTGGQPGWSPSSSSQPYGLEYQGQTGPNGERLDPYGIPSINLPEAAQVSTTVDPTAQSNYQNYMAGAGQNIKDQWNFETPNFNPAQMNQGGVPQPGAQQFMGASAGPAAQTQISPELQSMLNGEGYSPSILAQMRSRASEGASTAGRLEMGAAKRAMEQAGPGQTGSPASAALSADVARRTGNAQSSALRDIDIANAQQGQQNKALGLGMQTQIGLSNTGATNQMGQFNAGLAEQTGLTNMQQANQMAMENANRIFSSMSQNLANQQQASGAMFGAENQRRTNQAGAASNFAGNAANQWGNVMANQASQAPFANASAINTRNQNQALGERQRQLANQGAFENRWQTSANNVWRPGATGA